MSEKPAVYEIGNNVVKANFKKESKLDGELLPYSQSEYLTPVEISELRRIQKEAIAVALKAFQIDD